MAKVAKPGLTVGRASAMNPHKNGEYFQLGNKYFKMQGGKQVGVSYDDFSAHNLAGMNQARQKQGLPPLSADQMPGQPALAGSPGPNLGGSGGSGGLSSGGGTSGSGYVPPAGTGGGSNIQIDDPGFPTGGGLRPGPGNLPSPGNTGGGTGVAPGGSGNSLDYNSMPSMPAYTANGDNGDSMFRDLYNRATQGTINSFNTAANRLRERVDSSTQGNLDAANNRNLARGFGNSGLNDRDTFRAQQSGQNAYAQGLAGLEDDFEKNRLAGLQTAMGAANGIQGNFNFLNTLNQGDLSQRRSLGNSNWQLITQNLANLLNSREQRTSNEGMASAQRELERQLAALNLGNNKYPQQVMPGQIVGTPSSGSIGGSINGNIGVPPGGQGTGGGGPGSGGGIGSNYQYRPPLSGFLDG